MTGRFPYSELRRVGASLLILIVTGCGTSTAPVATGTVAGFVNSSLGGSIGGATVIVEPAKGGALPSVGTTAAGAYTVASVPIGSGSVTVSDVPRSCAAPAAVTYSALTNHSVATVNVSVTCTAAAGNVAGTIVNSAGGYVSGATVTVTPSGTAPLAPVVSQASGTFLVSGVPTGASGGSVAVTNLPTGCSMPAPLAYGQLAPGGSATVVITATCASSSGLSLGVGQPAIFASQPNFQAPLTMPANASYLIAVVNTDTTSGASDGLTLAGSTGPSISIVRGAVTPPHRPTKVVSLGSSRPMPRSASGGLEPAGWWRALEQSRRRHMATLELNRRVFARYGPRHPVPGEVGLTVHTSSLAGTKVGEVHRIYVNKLTGSCSDVDSINARTVYVGTHVQVLADVQAWRQRPDSSFYATFGSEFDRVTYPHLVSYIGDPLAYDRFLSGVGKVTIVFTPLVNTAGDAGFVNACDLYSPAQVPFSNVTELIYGWTPDPGTSGTVDFWERDFRGVTAHEAKHVVSLSHHMFDGATSFEQSWLEEGMAQESAEIWMRHFNTATWRGNSDFAQTVGCEITAYPCSNPSNPVFFSDRVFFELLHYLYDESSTPGDGGLSASANGKYGAGWEFARWATDQFAGSDEAGFIKSLVDEPTYTGLANISQHAGVPAPALIVYWSLATAFDSSTYADSATFHPTDSLVTVPSFDMRNVYAVAGGQDGWGFARAYPLNTVSLSPPTFSVAVPGLAATGAVYFFLPNGSSSAVENLQLLDQNGNPLPTTSMLRVGIIRVQ